jgi:ADP-heptose:LPS heptosyltransferase
VPLGSVELADARALVDELVGTSGPLVLLNPNAGDLVPLRRWPEERYVELAQRLLAARPDLRVLVTGAPDEAEAAQHVAARVGSDRCASAAGRTTLRGLLALYHQAEVLVTNDSGPAHYATLTPIEVVALFGPESPEVFGPVGRRAHALSARLVCSPCVNAFNDRRSPCADNLCMQRIEVDEVLATIEDLLRRRWPASP